MSINTDDLLRNNEQTDPQKWLDYLDGKLSPEEQRKLEGEIAQSDFLRDAMEGLHPVENIVDLNAVVNQLNHQLKQQLVSRKIRRKRRPATKGQNGTVVAILIILGVCLIGFFLYWKLYRP